MGPIRIFTKLEQPGEDHLLGRRTDQNERFASKVSWDDRVLAAEWVVRGKDDAPALLPQLFHGEPICRLRLRGKH